MKLIKSLISSIVLAGLMAPATSMAATYVICGESVDLETLEVNGYELELSSEWSYEGTVGDKWNLKLDQDGDWLERNVGVIAKESRNDEGQTLVEIKIHQDHTVTGPVGIRYVLTGLFDDEPTLQKFAMGGFAGGQRIGVYKCVSSND